MNHIFSSSSPRFSHRRLVRSIVLGASAWALLSAVSTLSAAPVSEPSVEDAGAFERLIARTVALRFPAIHYSHQELDDDASERLFEEYFSLLDPQHSYFLAEDLESFDHLRDRLDNLLKMGRVHFAYEVYNLYLERVRERIAFVQELLEDGVDLTAEEYYVPDRSEADWPADADARRTLWRRQVKNLLLTYSLMQTAGEDDPQAPESEIPTDDEDDSEDGQTDDEDAQADPTAKTATGEDRPPDEDQAAMRDNVDDAESKDAVDSPTTPPKRPEKTPEERVVDYFQRHLTIMEERDPIEVLEFFLLALARVYDPHSSYMAPDTEEDFDIHMKLSLEGIGALLTSEDGYVKIADIIAGGPAEQDGRLQPGDRIIEVSQGEGEAVDVINMPLRKVVDLIRGPKGTEVVLTVIEAEKGLGGVPVQIDIIRDEVKLKEQEAKAEIVPLDDCGARIADHEDGTDENEDRDGEAADEHRILLISLPSFYRDFQAEQRGEKEFKSSTRDVQRLIETHVDNGGLDGVILDLRGNGGGSLTEAVDLAGLFFTKGPVVQARYSNGDVRVLRDQDGETTFTGPLAVLVDRRSASASEIVAAVLQDMGRAVIVGTGATHGKGTIQTLYHLAREFQRLPAPFNSKEPGTLKITIGKFYRINGGATQLRGVHPDIVFEDYSDHLELGERSLTNPLPWDSINPVAQKYEQSVKPLVPKLKERSGARNAESATYAKRLELIRLFAERQEHDRVPLQREARVAYHEEQQKLSEQFERISRSGDNQDRNADDEEDDNQATDEETPRLWRKDDYVMAESCRILSDLIHLRAGEPLCDIQQQLPPEPELAGGADVDPDTEAPLRDVAGTDITD